MKYLQQLLISMMVLSGAASVVSADTGGDCNPQRRVELAQLTNLFGDAELTTASGHVYTVFREELPADIEIKKFDYFTVSSVRHLSGGCVPFSITGIEPLKIEGFSLNPIGEHTYPGAFRLAEVQFCSVSDEAICEAYVPIMRGLTDLQREALKMANVRTLGSCSAATMEKILPQLKGTKSDPRVIACAQKKQSNNQELALEFFLTFDKEEPKKSKRSSDPGTVNISKFYRANESGDLYFSIPDNN